MTKEITVEMLNELAANEAFVAEYQQAETAEEYAALMGRYGVEVTAEELAEGIALAQAMANKDELSEEDLEAVAGGGCNPVVVGLGITVGTLGLLSMMTVATPVTVGMWLGGTLTAGANLLKGPNLGKKNKKSKR